MFYALDETIFTFDGKEDNNKKTFVSSTKVKQSKEFGKRTSKSLIEKRNSLSIYFFYLFAFDNFNSNGLTKGNKHGTENKKRNGEMKEIKGKQIKC